ncbi:MAG: phospholipase D-like domain-containing protein [Bdellovibrionota bacterium]
MCFFKQYKQLIIKSIQLHVLFLYCQAFGQSHTDPSHQPTVWEESQGQYRVRFTNPHCKTYKYKRKTKANDGSLLTHKPKNAYCKYSDASSASHENAPLPELLDMIQDPDTHEIFLAFLSYSNPVIHNALCNASKERKVIINLVMDNPYKGSGRNDAEAIKNKLKYAKKLEQCAFIDAAGATIKPNIHLRGKEGSLGFAHNKLIIINPSETTIKLAFGSANLSSGVILHHENWHFVTIPQNTFFAQIHLCLKEGMLKHGAKKSEYANFLSQCRQNIIENLGYQEESDVKTFFIPAKRKLTNNKNVADGKLATELILKQINTADQIDLAAHRIKNKFIINALNQSLPELKLKIVVDDDIYWRGVHDTAGFDMPNTFDEYRTVTNFASNGAFLKYVETNPSSHLLHHNKFMIFYRDNIPYGVWTGAGNFTQSAFSSNYENFYYITIPIIVEEFAKQYQHLYQDLATAKEKLPVKNILP